MIKSSLVFLFCGLLVSGCVSEPETGYATEALETVILPGEENETNLPAGTMPNFSYGHSTTLLDSPCICEWEIWIERGMICLGEVCSESCEIRTCRERPNICQPL